MPTRTPSAFPRPEPPPSKNHAHIPAPLHPRSSRAPRPARVASTSFPTATTLLRPRHSPPISIFHPKTLSHSAQQSHLAPAYVAARPPRRTASIPSKSSAATRRGAALCAEDGCRRAPAAASGRCAACARALSITRGRRRRPCTYTVAGGYVASVRTSRCRAMSRGVGALARLRCAGECGLRTGHHCCDLVLLHLARRAGEREAWW
ncbi:hypothetical protein EJ04DRAFT_512242 [Polyplosphaeria fusca]|uniref:Uncharacterized protein n=1 Tax=Polyplosphaeria fusca TaxID=682080 RepID=A0A9P4V303_9PLEO|nr:hypothetical protein EJ04DRAFT_512242 [Polyplosphaeria fusca]